VWHHARKVRCPGRSHSPSVSESVVNIDPAATDAPAQPASCFATPSGGLWQRKQPAFGTLVIFAWRLNRTEQLHQGQYSRSGLLHRRIPHAALRGSARRMQDSTLSDIVLIQFLPTVRNLRTEAPDPNSTVLQPAKYVGKPWH
jgi:hypothetical protein